MRSRFDGFLCLMSLAGGTGSGLGTYVTEMLRDIYPKAFLINEVVAPYQSGEVILQSYNALLTLAHLYEVRAFPNVHCWFINVNSTLWPAIGD